MSTAFDLTQSIQDNVLYAVETSQRWTTEAVRALTATFDGFTAPVSSIPVAGGWPTPDEAVALSFGFAERLFSLNRQFVSDLMAVVSTPASSPPAGG